MYVDQRYDSKRDQTSAIQFGQTIRNAWKWMIPSSNSGILWALHDGFLMCFLIYFYPNVLSII